MQIILGWWVLFWRFFTQCLNKCIGTLLVLPPALINLGNYFEVGGTQPSIKAGSVFYDMI